ncbi:CRTAC1 family protein [Algirhabdus cladophorae]
MAFSAANASPQFSVVPVPSHQYSGEWEFFVGGGLAVFDCNSDNNPEVFAAGGAGPSTLLINTSTTEAVRFATNPSAASGLEDLTNVTGAYPLDIDSDGTLDLVILRVGHNTILQGQGDCQFAPFPEKQIPSFGDHWTTAFSATWEQGQTLPTMAFGNYIDRFDPNGPFETCDASFLHRPNFDGQDGQQGYSAALPLTPGYCTLSMLFSDWGRKGRADLRVSNDRHYYIRGGSEQLWSMAATPRLYGQADGWRDYSLWGMGIASRDLTGDGLPEIYLTSMGDQKLHSLTSTTEPSYENAPYGKGITAHRPYTGGDGRPSTGWHVAFGDVQNDGYDDIFVTKGNVEQMPVAAMQDPNNLLLGQQDGNFVEGGAEAGVASMDRGRGGAMVDLNSDGLLDLLVNNRRADLQIWQNTTADAGDWLSLALRQEGSNPFAIGAIVELRINDRLWTQERTIGGGHAGGSHVPLHFGLGDLGDQSVEITVIWPDQSQTIVTHDQLNTSIVVQKYN